MRSRSSTLGLIIALLSGLLLSMPTTVIACPFCSAASQTLSEEITGSDAVVLAKLVKEATPIDWQSEAAARAADADPDAGKATFRVLEVLRGKDRAAADQEIKVVYFGSPNHDTTFLINGISIEGSKVEWTTPLPLTEKGLEYVRALPTVPAAGAERLAFFQEYLENEDPLLAQDSYDEFAKAPYAELHDLKYKMKHDRIVEWITSPSVNPSRRGLYFTMLGICGSAADLSMLEETIASDYSVQKPIVDALVASGVGLHGPVGLPVVSQIVELDESRKKLGLNAAVACYLTLRGAEGLPLIEKRFLSNQKAEYAQIYSVIMALRFHGESTEVIPRARLLESMRLLLDNNDFADQVIPDLARWEDWTVLGRLTQMFKTADDKSYVRPPIVTYLTVASEQPGSIGAQAKASLAELERLAPKAVEQARGLMAFGALARARSTSPTSATGDAIPGATSADQANSGFEASAADVSAAAADTSAIPDPASFQDPTADPPATQQKPSITADEAAHVVVHKPLEAPEKAVTPFSLPLVIGAPFAAAALLAVVYWLILRWGAV